jgi:hypothetical protein
MSKVVLVLTKPINIAQSIMAIRKYTNVPINELKENIALKKPVYEAILFQNDKEEVAVKLWGIINDCEALGDTFKMYELDEDEDYDPVEEVDFHWISKDYLRNIMEENL